MIRSPRLVSRSDVEFCLDYGHFSLVGSAAVTGDGNDTLPALLEAAFDNGGIGQDGSSLTVVTPSQWDFAMPLRVELWSDTPPIDQSAWAEMVEGHLEVGDGSLVCVSPIDGFAEFDVPTGGYHAVICASPFGDDDPLRSAWCVYLWPSDGPAHASRIKPGVAPPVHPPAGEHLESGRLAAERINVDLGRGPDARDLDDQTGTAGASRTLRGTREGLFPYAANLSWWTSGPFSGFGDGVQVGAGWVIVHNDPCEDEFDGLPTGPEPDYADEDNVSVYELRGTYRRVDVPYSVETELQWFRDGQPVLKFPTVLTVRLAESTHADGSAATQVSFEHTRIPTSWTQDMAAIWRRKLEWGERGHHIAE